jgi:serine/threonine protein kinase
LIEIQLMKELSSLSGRSRSRVRIRSDASDGGDSGYHPSVLRLLDSYQDTTYSWAVLEYVAGDDLFSKMSSTTNAFGLPESCARRYFTQLVEGVQWLHEHKVCHRDLSLENLLLDSIEDRIKICDFGQARWLVPLSEEPSLSDSKEYPVTANMAVDTTLSLPRSQSQSHLRLPSASEMFANSCDSESELGTEKINAGGNGLVVQSATDQTVAATAAPRQHFEPFSGQAPGKTPYMAPELWHDLPRTFDGCAIDIFCMGVILFMMLVGAPPFKKADSSDKLWATWINRGRLKQLVERWRKADGVADISDSALDLLSRILCAAPQRLTIKEILRHPWMTQCGS